jgi:ABC-type transport system involved in multi-copper enzyme maturation permease subunit
MGKILTIGLNTFREAIRNKILYSLLFFAVVVIIASLAFGALSVHEEIRLTIDLGLAGTSLFSIIIAIFIGVNLVYKELQLKTIYTLIPKPIHRYQFILGKFIGMILTLAIQIAIMTAVLLVVISLQGATLTPALFKMITLIFFEVMIVTAVALLFSSFSTPFLSGLFTIGIFLLGRSVPDIRHIAAKVHNPALSLLLSAIGRLVPNLRLFYATGTELNLEHASVHSVFPDWSYVGSAGGYALLYVTVALMLSMLFFSRRDFI